MRRVASVFFVPYPAVFKQRLFQWLRQFSCVAFYDSNNYKNDVYSSYDCIAACANGLVDATGDPFAQASRLSGDGHFVFGYFGYDLKNKIERLNSEKPNHTGFPDACIFTADSVFELNGSSLRITANGDAHTLFESINQIGLVDNEAAVNRKHRVQNRTAKSKYLQTVEALRGHIEDGDFYEINYCQEFFCENADIEPTALFNLLQRKSGAPFGAYLKLNDLHLMSASPERFLKRDGDTVVSQPIKGTIARDFRDPLNDERLKATLHSSEKDKAENVMIVDLVRNDFNRVCKTGSVAVDALFDVVSFLTVHHMISTITGVLRPDVTFQQIFRSAFPMGSMTGAPKVQVMKAIEFYEDAARGAYSGAVGFLKPNGDFDFSVVIRTVLWNQTTGYLSFHAGGAVTFDSNAEDEYAESLLKAKAIKDILENGAFNEI